MQLGFLEVLIWCLHWLLRGKLHLTSKSSWNRVNSKSILKEPWGKDWLAYSNDLGISNFILCYTEITGIMERNWLHSLMCTRFYCFLPSPACEYCRLMQGNWPVLQASAQVPTLLAIAHSKSVIDYDIRSNSHSAYNGHCPSSLLSILLSFPDIYNHVQALVIGLDVISLCSGTFIASAGFPVSPYRLSPCCMYFLLGVQSLMFFIWVNYDLSFFHNFWSHNTAEVLVLAAGPVLHTLPHLTPPPHLLHFLH